MQFSHLKNYWNLEIIRPKGNFFWHSKYFCDLMSTLFFRHLYHFSTILYFFHYIELWECSRVIWLFIIHKIKYVEQFEIAYDINGLTLKHMSSLCLTYIGTTRSVKGTLNLKSHDKLLSFRRLCWVLTFWASNIRNQCSSLFSKLFKKIKSHTFGMWFVRWYVKLRRFTHMWSCCIPQIHDLN